MTRSQGHRFANQALPDAVFDNPLAFAQTLANQRQALQLVASIWDRAGSRLSAADRVSGAGLTATLEQRGPFVVIHVAVPPPREIGDPAAIAIVGCGDGERKFDAVSYYILELGVDTATRETKFIVVSRTPHDEHGTNRGDGPPPDSRLFGNHVCELAVNRTPSPPIGAPNVPAWYWWYVFRGAAAMRTWLGARDAAGQLRAMQREPILLLPEIDDAANLFVGGNASTGALRQCRAQLRGDNKSFGPACLALANLLVNGRGGSAAANLSRALPVIAEAREYGVDAAQSNLLEAAVRKRLAEVGIDVRKNYEEAQRLLAQPAPQAAATAVAEPARRVARGTTAPPTVDPSFATLFLDTSELPYFTRGERDMFTDPAFIACGGLNASYNTWVGQDSWPMARIIDTRWLFPTPVAADRYLMTVMAMIGDSLPPIPTPQLGDATLAFGASRTGQIVVVRVGRMVAKLCVVEGAGGLDTSMVLPLVQRIVQRAQWMLSRYWLTVGRGTDAANVFALTPNPRLLAEYPILALPEFPAAMATLGDAYAPSAHALWNLQTQLRSQQWQAHRDATRALVRTLLDDRESDPRVNAAHAFALVAEMRRLDADPIWAQLEAECRSRP